MMPYNECRQFTPNSEGGARSNATLFDNCQQKNSRCRVAHLKTKPLDGDHVLILNASLTDKGVYFKGLRTQLFAKWSFVLVYPTSLIRHKSKYFVIFPYLRCRTRPIINRNVLEIKLIEKCDIQVVIKIFAVIMITIAHTEIVNELFHAPAWLVITLRDVMIHSTHDSIHDFFFYKMRFKTNY